LIWAGGNFSRNLIKEAGREWRTLPQKWILSAILPSFFQNCST